MTGAGGFIGHRLLRRGDRGLVRAANGLQDAVIGDLLDVASLRHACRGVETVYHCAGYAHAFSSSDSDAHWRINYEGTRNLLDVAGESGVRRFVFLSSVKAMAEPGDACADEDWPGEPETPYGKAKRAAEDAVLAAGPKYGMHVVNLRLAMVYGQGGRGNLERMAQGIRAGWFPPLPETGNRRSLVHIDDVVAVIRLAAQAPAANGGTYIVADPQAYSGRQIYDAIRAILACPAGSKKGLFAVKPTFRIPAWLLRSGGRAGDALGALMRSPLPMNSEVVERLLGSAHYSPARIERALGWRAEVGLEAGLREMLGK